MKQFKYVVEASDDFEVGACYDCPLYNLLSWNSEAFGCDLGYCHDECPLVEEIQD